jgi:prolyl-tRNA synthetase
MKAFPFGSKSGQRTSRRAVRRGHRHNREKHFIPIDELGASIPKLLEEVRSGIYNIALKLREERTYRAVTIDEIMDFSQINRDFLKRCGAAIRNASFI